MESMNKKEMDDRNHTLVIEGRNAVLEAFRSGKPIDKVFVLDGCQDGPIRTIVREAKKYDAILNFVGKDRLNQLSVTGKHQGVVAYAAAYEYAEVEDMLKLAKERGEDPQDHHRVENKVGDTVQLRAEFGGAFCGSGYKPVQNVCDPSERVENIKEPGQRLNDQQPHRPQYSAEGKTVGNGEILMNRSTVLHDERNLQNKRV